MTRGLPILVLAATALAFAVSSVAVAQEQGRGNAAYDYRAVTGQFKPAVVRRVKWDLNKAGYYAGPMDSSWGADARDALAKYQQAHGLDATGEIDAATLKALDVRVAPVPNGNGEGKGAPLSGAQARGAVEPGAQPPPTPGADGAYERVQEMQKNQTPQSGGAGANH